MSAVVREGPGRRIERLSLALVALRQEGALAGLLRHTVPESKESREELVKICVTDGSGEVTASFILVSWQ